MRPDLVSELIAVDLVRFFNPFSTNHIRFGLDLDGSISMLTDRTIDGYQQLNGKNMASG